MSFVAAPEHFFGRAKIDLRWREAVVCFNVALSSDVRHVGLEVVEAGDNSLFRADGTVLLRGGAVCDPHVAGMFSRAFPAITPALVAH